MPDLKAKKPRSMGGDNTGDADRGATMEGVITMESRAVNRVGGMRSVKNSAQPEELTSPVGKPGADNKRFSNSY